VDGDDRDGARVPDDDAIEGLAGGVEEVQTVHPEHRARRSSSSETRRKPGIGLGDGVEVEQVRLAPLRPFQCRGDQVAEQGWARSGRLLNSGWAWVATQYGCSSSSTNSTSRPVGRDPGADQTHGRELRLVAVVELESGAR